MLLAAKYTRSSCFLPLSVSPPFSVFTCVPSLNHSLCPLFSLRQFFCSVLPLCSCIVPSHLPARVYCFWFLVPHVFSGLFFVSHLFRMFLLFCYLPLLAKVFFMLIELALRSNHLPSCSYGHGLDVTTFLRSDCLFENNNGRSSRCKQSCC